MFISVYKMCFINAKKNTCFAIYQAVNLVFLSFKNSHFN